MAGKAHGNVPGEVQHAGLGELFAFYQLLVHCIPPVVAVTDYENLVTGLDAGKKVCTASGQKDAGAWKRIWDKVEDIGRENIQLIKVPAHKSRQDVLNGTAGISIRDWTGNAEADKAARAGARLHPSSEGLRQQIKDGHDMAKMVCKWLGTLGGHLCKLGSPDVDARPQQHVRGLELVDIPRSSLTPTWHWKPRLLHQEEKKVRQQEVLPEVAEESPPALVQQKHPHSSHCLREIVGAPRIIFCWTCGAYCGGGAKRVTQPSAKFQAVCKGHSGTLQAKLKRCRKGHHPTTNRYLGVGSLLVREVARQKVVSWELGSSDAVSYSMPVTQSTFGVSVGSAGVSIVVSLLVVSGGRHLADVAAFSWLSAALVAFVCGMVSDSPAFRSLK